MYVLSDHDLLGKLLKITIVKWTCISKQSSFLTYKKVW